MGSGSHLQAVGERESGLAKDFDEEEGEAVAEARLNKRTREDARHHDEPDHLPPLSHPSHAPPGPVSPAHIPLMLYPPALGEHDLGPVRKASLPNPRNWIGKPDHAFTSG